MEEKSRSQVTGIHPGRDWQPSDPQLQSHGEGSPTPLPGSQAGTSPVLRSLSSGRTQQQPAPKSIPPLTARKRAPRISVTERTPLPWPGSVLFQLGLRGGGKRGLCCGLPAPGRLLAKAPGQHFRGGGAGAGVPQRPSCPSWHP